MTAFAKVRIVGLAVELPGTDEVPSALSPRMRALGRSRQLSGAPTPRGLADRINPHGVRSALHSLITGT